MFLFVLLFYFHMFEMKPSFVHFETVTFWLLPLLFLVLLQPTLAVPAGQTIECMFLTFCKT